MSDRAVSEASFMRIHITSFRLLIMAVIIICLIISWAWLAPESKAGQLARIIKAEEALARAPARSVPAQGRFETEIVTLRSTGFEPAEISRPAGRFLLAIDNRSGVEEVLLRLSREGGPVLMEARLPRGQKKWRQALDLTPGTYTLAEANNQDWRCLIIIK